MNEWTWVNNCCEKSASDCQHIGYDLTSKTIAEWNIQFRVHTKFPHPNPTIASGKTTLLPIFDIFPEAKEMIISQCTSNLADMTIQQVHNYIIDELIPALHQKVIHELDNITHQQTSTHNQAPLHLIESLIEYPPSPTTIWRWLKTLHFQYDTSKKNILCRWT